MNTFLYTYNKVLTSQLLRHSDRQAALFTVHISIYSTSNTDEITTVLLHSGDDGKVTRLFYTTVHSLKMVQ